MPDDEVPAEPVAAHPNEIKPIASPLISVPNINFSEPTGDPLLGVRKGFGAGEVGGNGPTAPPEPPMETRSEP
jgi:hypothetical protein